MFRAHYKAANKEIVVDDALIAKTLENIKETEKEQKKPKITMTAVKYGGLAAAFAVTVIAIVAAKLPELMSGVKTDGDVAAPIPAVTTAAASPRSAEADYPTEDGSTLLLPTQFPNAAASLTEAAELYHTPDISDFSFELAAAVFDGNEKENIIISPASVYMALTAASESYGDPALITEMLNSVNITDYDTAVQNSSGIFLSNLTQDSAFYNSMWIDENTEPDAELMTKLANTYYTECRSTKLYTASAPSVTDYWICRSQNHENCGKWEQTGYFPGAYCTNDKLFDESFGKIFVSTSEFHTGWSPVYNFSTAGYEEFTTPTGAVKAEMLNFSGYANVREEEEFKAVQFGLSNGADMTIILPDEDIPSPVSVIKESNFMRDIVFGDSYRKMPCDITIPKFETLSKVDLGGSISSSDEYLGFIQAHSIRVDENGCSAYGPAPKDDMNEDMGEVEFETATSYTSIIDCNRPFIYVISNEDTVLYIGMVYYPLS